MIALENFPLPVFPDLAGKVAVVTGGSGGLGSAVCFALAKNGVRIAVNGRNQKAIDTVVDSIQSEGGEAIGITSDCTHSSQLEQMSRQVESRLGNVDLLVAYAGGGIAKPRPVIEISEEEWRSSIDNNLTSTFLTVKTFLPGMIARNCGSIVTMASAGGRVASGAPAAYGAAKAGIIMFNRHLASEVGRHGIRVNCISPSAVLTPRTLNTMPEERRKAMLPAFPLGRLGTPEDIAAATLFLLSSASSWITGITLDVAGGRVML